jgi:hypothetical protein
MEKVFGIGFSKTGTTSFEYAMEHFGYKVYHGNYILKHNDYMLSLWIHRDYDEIKRMSKYWDAFADAPWGGTDLYKKLYEWYPSAKFVHTIRDAEKWYESMEKMLMRFDSNPATALDTYHANDRYGFSYFFKHTYGVENLVGNKQKIIDFYNKHNREVEEFMIKNKANYLKFNSIEEQGWKTLCPFLGVPIPEIDYPHKNNYAPIEKPVEKKVVPPPPKLSFGRRVINKIKRMIKA